MRIDCIGISPETQRKIYEKHNILSSEIELVLKHNRPIFRKVGSKQIMAIGLYNRYITVFFKYNKKRKQAIITTENRSSFIRS